MAITLHEGQSEVYKDLFIDKEHRFATVCCSRGWGKSYMGATSAVTAVFELLELDESVPNKNVFIIAPTYDQVTDIYFPIINYDLGIENYCIKAYREQGRFKFPKGVELRLLSYEAVERVRGKGAYFAVWDEVSSCKRGITPREAWEDVLQPAIITRWSPRNAKFLGAKSPGRMLAIGTPKGYNYFHDLYVKEEVDARWKSYHFDYKQSPFLDIDEIEALRHTLDPITFASEYLASFEESGNNVFYCFKRKIHVKADIEYFIPPVPDKREKGEDVHVCIDFNVGYFWLTINLVNSGDILIGQSRTKPVREGVTTIRKEYTGSPVEAPDRSGKISHSTK